jgi:energy-coupling factor transporter ATP-binding protein EcfA2
MEKDPSENLVEVRDLVYTYPEAPHPVLDGTNLTLHKGEMVILAGPSGCGKSTLCKHLNGIIPHLSSGEVLGGSVVVNGLDVADTPVHLLATHVGMVFQNPETQICCLYVEDELAFGPENVGFSHEEIVRRVNELMDQLSLRSLEGSLTFELSGGQKQRLAIGSSLALLPDLLVLDEPTTDLDPVGAHDVVCTLRSLRDQLGLTFLVVEHDLDELLELADRLVVMDYGQVAYDGSPVELFNRNYAELDAIGLRIPQHIRMSRMLAQERDSQAILPIGRQEALAAFAEWAGTLRDMVALPDPRASMGEDAKSVDGVPAIKLENVTFSYTGHTNAVEQVDLEIQPGEFVAVVGANGSGKSTLARLVIGLLHPQEGTISIMGTCTTETDVEAVCERVGYLFQNPDSQLFNSTVVSEIAFGMRVKRLPEELIQQRVDQVLSLLRLQHLADRHPFSLSRGERQRLAVATVLVTDPDIIILDEPTTGQDRRMLDGILSLMHEWIGRKKATVLMIAHDMDLVCTHATRVIVLRDGRIVCDGQPSEVFYRHFDTLRQMNLLPPAIVEASYPFVGTKLPRVLLSIEEFGELLAEVGRTGRQFAQGDMEDRRREGVSAAVWTGRAATKGAT